MPNERFCNEDDFAIVLSDMILDVVEDVEHGLLPVVEDACDVAITEIKANAKKSWDKYPNEFSRTVTKVGEGVVGEVGNKKRPGLVHLLEKGHAKIGGGRVEGHDHMAKAAKEAEKAFMEEMQDMLDVIL